MSKTPEASPSDVADARVALPEAGGGITIPAGLDALAGVLPSSIPPDMFEEAPPSAPVVLAPAAPPPRVPPMKPPSIPRMAAVKPPSISKMAAVKPPSIAKMAAVKPPSIAKMAAVKPPSIPKMPAVKPPSIPKMPAVKPPVAEAADVHGNVTVQMPVAKMPLEAIPSEPPLSAEHPSSFPSSGRMLVFEVPAPSSLDAVVVPEALPSSSIVVTPAHEWLAAHGGDGDDEDEDEDEDEAHEELTDVSSRNRPTLLAAGVRKRRWPRVLAVLAVAAIACALLSGKLAHTRATAQATVPPATPAVAPAAAQPSPLVEAPATPLAEPVSTAPAAPAAPAAPPATTDDDKGRLSTVGTAPGRRIFVDDRTVGETPNVVVLPCGSHRVRVGSRGNTTILDIPCGGELTVSDR